MRGRFPEHALGCEVVAVELARGRDACSYWRRGPGGARLRAVLTPAYRALGYDFDPATAGALSAVHNLTVSGINTVDFTSTPANSGPFTVVSFGGATNAFVQLGRRLGW